MGHLKKLPVTRIFGVIWYDDEWCIERALDGSKNYCSTFTEELTKTMKGLSQDTRRAGRDSNRELSELKSRTSSQFFKVKLTLTQAGRVLLTTPFVYSPAHTLILTW
jgi:hypothetical protein